MRRPIMLKRANSQDADNIEKFLIEVGFIHTRV